jgi:hypothetical protein
MRTLSVRIFRSEVRRLHEGDRDAGQLQAALYIGLSKLREGARTPRYYLDTTVSEVLSVHRGTLTLQSVLRDPFQ